MGRTMGNRMCAEAVREPDLDEPKAKAIAAPHGRDLVHDEIYNRWVFSLLGGIDAARVRLESILTARVEKIARQCALTQVQKKKLLLAGRGDIKRMLDRVAEIRARLEGDANDRTRLLALLDELGPPRVDSSGDPFGEGSIYSKALKKTLTAEQSARYEKVAHDGAAFPSSGDGPLGCRNLGHDAGPECRAAPAA